jgi:hypothetical protein
MSGGPTAPLAGRSSRQCSCPQSRRCERRRNVEFEVVPAAHGRNRTLEQRHRGPCLVVIHQKRVSITICRVLIRSSRRRLRYRANSSLARSRGPEHCQWSGVRRLPTYQRAENETTNDCARWVDHLPEAKAHGAKRPSKAVSWDGAASGRALVGG